MRIALFGKPFQPKHNDAVKHLVDRIIEIDSNALFYGEFRTFLEQSMYLPDSLGTFSTSNELKGCDLIFSVGGDGTFLECVTLASIPGVPIMGINTGTLGFLSNVGTDSIDVAMDSIVNGKTWIDERALFKVEAEGMDLGDFPYAINEVAIHKHDTASMVVVEVYRNEKLVNTYWADGLLVSTATGSTAYSLSAGGPIISPSSDVAVITPLAPHNLTNRPLVVPLEGEITLSPDGRDGSYLLSLDSRSYHISPKCKVSVKPAPFKVRFVNLEHQNFFHTLRSKMHWGIDPRER